MNDATIDALVRDADPAPRSEIAALDLGGADRALLEEILSTPRVAPLARRPRSLRSRLVTGVAAAAVTTAAIGVPAWLSGQDHPDQGRDQTARRGDGTSDLLVYSAAAIKAAEKNPRLLVDQPGWVATTVYGFTRDQGTVGFTKGGRTLEMDWYPADSYDSYYRDRLDVSRPEDATVAGQDGALFTYSGHDFAVMLKPDGGSFVELRADAADKADFLGLLATIRKASVEEWLAAMPPEIVKPDGARTAVEAMLADIPTPPGFDVDPLLRLGPSDRYQLGAHVTGAVACGWFSAWKQARDAGDATAVRRAEAALASSRHWKILDEMNPRGDWPEGLWDLSDRVAAGQPVAQIEESLGDTCSGG